MKRKTAHSSPMRGSLKYSSPHGSRKCRFTYVLIALLAIVFAAELVWPQLVDGLAFSPDGFSAQPWTFVTAVFAHADLTHLLANIVVLWFFGLAVEQELKPGKTALLFFLGAFLGEVLSVFVYPSDALSLGASGGIFALVGAGMLVRPFFELTEWHGAATIPLVFLGVVYIAYNIVGVFVGPYDVAYLVHFAGLAVGIVIGLYCRKKLRGG